MFRREDSELAARPSGRSAFGENPRVFSFLVNSSQLIAFLHYTTGHVILNLSRRRAVTTATGFTTKGTMPHLCLCRNRKRFFLVTTLTNKRTPRSGSCWHPGSSSALGIPPGTKPRAEHSGPKQLLCPRVILARLTRARLLATPGNRFLNFNQTSKAGAASQGARSPRHHAVPQSKGPGEPQQWGSSKAASDCPTDHLPARLTTYLPD